MSSAKTHTTRVNFGPGLIPVVPYSHFSRLPPVDLQAVWHVIGPTVNRNIDRPLWLQFVAVYLEGMNHAAGVINGDV